MKTLALLLSVTMLAAPVQHANAVSEFAKNDPANETANPTLKPYPLDTCLVSGEKHHARDEFPGRRRNQRAGRD